MRGHIQQRGKQSWRIKGLGTGPIPNVVRLLETRGVVCTRLPAMTRRVFAFSCEGHHPNRCHTPSADWCRRSSGARLRAALFLVAMKERMMSTLDPLDVAIEALGIPRYRSDDVAIFEADCLEALQKLDQALFPLVITSPPYNIGKAYEEPLPMRDYLSWCESWLKGLHSVCLPDGAFWLNLGYVPLDGVGKAVPLPYLLWERSPFFLIQEVVWNYGAGVAARHSFSPRNEKFLWYVKDPANYYFDLDAVRDPDVKYPNQKKNGKLKCNPLGKNPTDVWTFPKVTSGANRSSKERTKHPAQFPLAVIERIILATSRPGDVVLDPFMGSGTVAEAAVRHGRRAVGFEIEPDYIDIAAERLDRLSAAPILPLGEVSQ